MARQRTFEALIASYSRLLYRYAYWLCKDASAAEDLVQETFLKAWAALGYLRSEKAALSWLLTILRREHYRVSASLDARATLGLDAIGEMASPASVTIDEMSVRSAIMALPTSLREPLILRLLEDLSIAEIAGVLGISAASATTRLFRARQAIRRRLLEGDTVTLDREFGT